LDEKDQKILEILKLDARVTNNAIAQQLNLSEGAIRNRIKHLVKTGVIRRFTIDTGSERAEAIVLIKTETKGSKEILKRIRKHATRFFETAGEYDVAALITAENIQGINSTVDKLRSVSGVLSTTTLLKIAEEQTS
jgi:Lrp/AsnC family transcriptional regulator of lysine biosynthesis